MRARPPLAVACALAPAWLIPWPGRAEEVPRSHAEITLSFAPVVRSAAPAVVNIYARKQQPRSFADPFSSDPFFRFLAIGGRAVPDAKALDFRLAIGAVGASTELRVRRNGAAFNLQLPLETPPYEPAPDASRLDGRHALAGATLAYASPGLNRELGRDLSEAGVIVLEVEALSPAARLRLRRGDLIRTVAGKPVDDVAQLKVTLRDRALPWRLEVERAGQRLAVVIGG